MNKTESRARKYQLCNLPILAVNKYINSVDFQSTNNFYHIMTSNAQNALKDHGKEANPVLEQLDPSTFEVAAKKQSTMWHSDQYKSKEFR